MSIGTFQDIASQFTWQNKSSFGICLFKYKRMPQLTIVLTGCQKINAVLTMGLRAYGFLDDVSNMVNQSLLFGKIADLIIANLKNGIIQFMIILQSL